MRGWWIRVAVILLILGPITASAGSSPRVLTATPGIDGSSIARFTLRFSDDMAPVGGGGASPITMRCSVGGKGRWVDPQTYVFEFDRPLPGGITCEAQLKPGLRTLDGHDVSGTQSFPIDTGGPIARSLLPSEGGYIEEDQAFFVAVNGAVDRSSIAKGAYCAVDGIGERIPVDLLDAKTVDDVLTAMGNNWRRRSFLEEGGMPNMLAEDAGERATMLRNVVGLKCRRPLPPGRDMSVVWGGSIKSPSGRTAGKDHRFDYSVRKEFSARLSCSRVNAQAGCDPIEAISVQYSAPVPRAQALAARIDVGGGKLVAPVDEGHDPTLTEVTFKPPLPPAIMARLVLPADLKDDSGRSLGNARRFPLEFEIASTPPLVKFAAPFGILETSQGGILPVTVRGVEPELAQGIKGISGGTARIEANDGAVADWVRKVAQSQREIILTEKRGKDEVQVNYTGAKSVFAGNDAVEPTRLALPGKGKEFEVVGIPLVKPGFYVVELASPELGKALLGRNATRYVAAAALVTDMTVHFKWGRGASLAWVTSLGDGKPVDGAAVKVTDSCTGKLLASGTTDRSGRVLIPSGLPDPSGRENCDPDSDQSGPLMVSARYGEDYSFVLTSWDDGIHPYDFDLNYGWNAPEPIFHTILDRTLLRAGETVHMKHVYRAPIATGFRSAGELKAVLILSHRGSETSYELPLTLGGDGIGETEWMPPKGTPTGDYDIRVKIGDKTVYTNQSVRVDEYRLPTMRASVSGPRTPAVRPKQIPVDLYVGFLSGGGSPRAPVRVRTAWETLNDSPDDWDGWRFGGSAVREGTVPVDQDDNDGSNTMLPSASTIPLALDSQGALRTSLDVPELTDSARMTVEMDYQDANGETLTASTSIPVYASAVRLGIKPDGWIQRANEMKLKFAALDLAGKTIRGQKIEVALYTREILSWRRRLIGGFYAFDNSARTTRLAGSCSVATDSHGLADCSLDPDVSGEVIAVATTRDRDGNEARAVTSVYLAGNDDWWFGGDNGDRMDIIADAKAYRAGDTAEIQVRMPFRKATALVTVEREGVLTSFVTTLSGKDPVVKVKLDGSYAPDVYISVMAVRGRIAAWKVLLAELAQKYHLPFFDPKMANPTAIVDLAKPSYRIGMTKVKVGWEGHELKVKVRPDRQRYRVRETAQVDVEVRGPGGRPPASAEIAFAAVDEALLQLSPNDSWDVLGAMMGDRPISVLTSSAQMQVVGRRHYGRKAVAAGGGGGGDLSALTRADFRPVLLWRGRVQLDERGRARIAVPMADSLSSYKLVAIATAGEQYFGSGSATVRTVQDLTIYSGLPPLVRTGDFYGGMFTLRNGTDKAITVTASADIQPAVTLQGPQTVTVPAGGAVPVSWQLNVPEGVDQLRWTVTASVNGKPIDRIQVDEQVIPAVPEEVWASYFLRVGPTPIPVGAPPGALPGRGGVDVALITSPAPPLDGVRAYMLAYPYGCFEQRLSKAVALGDREAWDRLVDALPTYIAQDGLLRYWPDDGMSGSVALTAYALSITAEAGLPWPKESKDRLIESLKSVVDGRLVEESQGPVNARLVRLAAVAALARNGAATQAMIGQTAIAPADMPTATLADWLVTLDKLPAGNARRVAAAEAALRARIVYEGTRLDLVDRKNAPWWMMVSGDEMALKAVRAVIGRRGWEKDAPRMMVGVTLRRQRGHWDTTPSNAWGTVITRRFNEAYPGASGGITTAKLGGETVTQKWSGAGAILFPLPKGTGQLALSHNTAPPPWAYVSVRAAVPLTAPAFSGYRVAREVSFLERLKPGQISRGDVLKIRLTIDAPVDRTWVVVQDPIPAGASIVSGVGGQSSMFAAQASGGNAWPAYIERGLDAWRAYFDWLPQGRTTVEYAVRINTDGRFMLPPTRVEAMYSPEIHASLPNQVLTVSP